MHESKLITSVEKIHFKEKVAGILEEITKAKQTLPSFGIEIVYENASDTEKLSESDIHRQKIYDIEQRSFNLDKRRLHIEHIQMLVAEAALYSAFLSNDSMVHPPD